MKDSEIRDHLSFLETEWLLLKSIGHCQNLVIITEKRGNYLFLIHFKL